jgi:hypothetical protein
VASVDFSHNSDVLEGLKYNQETAKALETFDTNAIMGFDNRHLDSPESAVALLMSMLKTANTKWTVWQDTHSGILQNDPRQSGTSYLIGTFSAK